jgi:Zn-dependent protease
MKNSQLLSDGLHIGTYFKVPVFLHVSWLIVFTVVLFSIPQISPILIMFFGIVLAHEFGHVLAGQYFGQKAFKITLYPIGGVAMMDIPKKPEHELLVTLAGPFVNVLFIPILWAISIKYEFFVFLSYLNFTMLAFNLIPAFPMDGGRILRSVLSRWTQNRKKSTLIAVRVSQVICVGFVVYGFYNSQFMLAVIGFVMFIAGKAELDEVMAERDLQANPRLSTNVSEAQQESLELLNKMQIRLLSLERPKKD